MGTCTSSTASGAPVAPDRDISKAVATKTLRTLPSGPSINDQSSRDESANDEPITVAESDLSKELGSIAKATEESIDVKTGIVAAIGTAGLIHDAVRIEDSTSGALILEAGAALLEAFEHVPFVAPAAFLIGAVARASMEAVVLREDCKAYAETTKRVERALLKARNIESQREPVETIVGVLEESLALVKHLATRGMVASVVRSCKDAKKLAEYKDDLVDAVALLQLECTLELNAMREIELNQARELEAKIEEMGGIDECVACKEKTAALSELLSKSDALIIAKMDHLVDQTCTSMNKMTNSVDRLSVVQSEAMKSVDSHFLKIQQEAEKASMRNAVLEQQVSALANTLVEVKDMLKKCPVSTNEPARLIAVNESGAMKMTPESESWDSLECYAYDVYNLLGGEVCVAVNFISYDTSRFSVFYLPSPDGGLSKPVNVATNDVDSITSPRKATVCQHVVHRAETIEFLGMQNAPPNLTPSEFQLVSQVDPTITSKMEKNKENGVFCDKENGCPFNAVWWDLQVNATDTVWYRGQPIFCNGLAIGSFCCVSPEGKPKDFDLRVKPLVELNAARIGLAMERQALTAREQDLTQLAMKLCPCMPPRTASVRVLNNEMPLPVQTIGTPNTLPTFFGADDLVNFVH